MPRAKISAVIITKNEEKRLPACIAPLDGWVDEIIVVDDTSTDNTELCARSLGAKVFKREMDIEGRHRNWAYGQASNEWVLSIDADEIVTDELKTEIDTVLSSPVIEENVFALPRKNYLGSYWLRWGGQYPSAQNKLFRKEKFKWEEKADVHPRAIYTGKVRILQNAMHHFTYANIADFLRKLNNQTTLEARKWHRVYEEDPKKAWKKMNFMHAVWRTADRFIRAYIMKKGYRDGFYGFVSAYFGAVYQMVSYMKYRELQKKENA